jgi:hypothetical protein
MGWGSTRSLVEGVPLDLHLPTEVVRDVHGANRPLPVFPMPSQGRGMSGACGGRVGTPPWCSRHNRSYTIYSTNPPTFGKEEDYQWCSPAEGQSLSGGRDHPLIVDLDAHVVEPPDVWSNRLPARCARWPLTSSTCPEEAGAQGPRTSSPRRRDWIGVVVLRRPPASIKRTIAAAGRDDEVQLRGVTYDEMRPGAGAGATG